MRANRERRRPRPPAEFCSPTCERRGQGGFAPATVAALAVAASVAMAEAAAAAGADDHHQRRGRPCAADSCGLAPRGEQAKGAQSGLRRPRKRRPLCDGDGPGMRCAIGVRGACVLARSLAGLQTGAGGLACSARQAAGRAHTNTCQRYANSACALLLEHEQRSESPLAAPRLPRAAWSAAARAYLHQPAGRPVGGIPLELGGACATCALESKPGKKFPIERPAG